MKKTISLLILLFIAASAFSITIYIPADYSTIQAGVDASSPGDTVLVSPGTYYENVVIDSLNIWLASKFLITNDLSYIDSTIIDASDSGTCIYIRRRSAAGYPDDISHIVGFTIQNANNTEGGGVWCDDSDPEIMFNKIHSNYVSDHGAGIACHESGSPTIHNNWIFNNSSDNWSGGIHCYRSKAKIYNNYIYENTATSMGGGIGIDSLWIGIDSLWIDDSTSVEDSIFIINNTIVGNISNIGAGLALWRKASAIVFDNIFWGNDSSVNGIDIYLDGSEGNTHIDFDYNDIYSISSPYIVTDPGCTVDYRTNNNITSPPVFVDMPNDDLHLHSVSPCIDMGMPVTTGWQIPNQDCDLQARVINSRIDIGADEFYGEPQTYDYDFGDAPDPFPTLITSSGAQHVIDSTIYLGDLIDAETDGQPNANATGDNLANLDDEEGVTFTSIMMQGEMAYVTVKTSANGYLNCWIDFNGDSDWNDAGEKIFTDTYLNSGDNDLDFAIPSSANADTTFSRFRFNSSGGLSYTGLAADGEVEDYQVIIHKAIDDCKMHYPQMPDPLGWDVNVNYPKIIADDWECTESGAVDGIHFWVSWKGNGGTPELIDSVHISIHSNQTGSPATPGSLLWERNFAAGEFEYIKNWDQGLQGWFDPWEPTVIPDDHNSFHLINITDIENPFMQEEGTIYWLDLSVFVSGGGSNEVVATLDGVDSDIQPNEVWTENNVELFLSNLSDTAAYGIEADRILLYPAQLNADLSNLSGTVNRVEIDIDDNYSIGCTNAKLYEGSSLLDSTANTTLGPSTLILYNSGASPDLVTMGSFGGAILEIRIYMEGGSEKIGWKTSQDFWNSSAVYWNNGWFELDDPNTDESLDMAFYISQINAPSPVTDLEISHSTPNLILLTWTPVSASATYNVYSSTDPLAPFPSGWTLESSGIPDSTWTDYVYPPTWKKFYIVTAEN